MEMVARRYIGTDRIDDARGEARIEGPSFSDHDEV